MTEDELEAQTRPDTSVPVDGVDLAEEDSSVVMQADDVADDPSATGVLDEELPGEELATIAEHIPEHQHIDLKAEEQRNRAIAFKQFRIMPPSSWKRMWQ